MIELCMLASGSSGNAVYVSSGHTRLLIDAGLSGRKIVYALAQIGVEPATLDALLISHEHNDHVSGAGVMARRYRLPVYATSLTWQALGGKLGPLPGNCSTIMPLTGRFAIKDLSVETFPVPHDAAGPVGFLFRSGNSSLALLTDLGCVTMDIIKKVCSVTCLVLEANHDEKMLMNSTYPWSLKNRILSNQGHLSNIMAAESLTKILSPLTRHLVLAHLSEQNNLPSLALDTVCDRLERSGCCKPGKSIRVQVADRYSPSCHIKVS